MAVSENSPGTYLMVVPVPAFPLSSGAFAIESAFGEHLVMLRAGLGALGRDMVLAAPRMSDHDYERNKNVLRVLDAERDGITLRPLFPASVGRFSYFKHFPGVLRALYQEVRRATVVHSGNSALFRPFEFPSLLMGHALGKKTISVTDIDHRESSRMNLVTGRWSRKQYLVTRLLHEPYSHLQQTFGARNFSLVLLKGAKLTEDYGKGRPNVKNFLDSAFGAEHLISEERLAAKCREVRDPNTPVRFTFFGRIVEYKGIDHMLRAVRRAIDVGATNFSFEVLGSGPAREGLEALSRELGLESHVVFHGAVPFGRPLFELLYDYHVLLAAPLSQDTPRSALDAAAAGQVSLAYDTYYYRELATAGAPVELVPWLDHQALGDKLAALTQARDQLATDMQRAVQFAVSNTQEAWLQRRIEWTRELFAGE